MSTRKTPALTQEKGTPNSALALIEGMFGGVPGWDEAVSQATARSEAAQEIYDLRERHGLTQQQLAEVVGTTQSVIARLEDASYEGHTLRMLNRIAAAVGEGVAVRFVPLALHVEPEVARKAAKGTEDRASKPLRSPERPAQHRPSERQAAAFGRAGSDVGEGWTPGRKAAKGAGRVGEARREAARGEHVRKAGKTRSGAKVKGARTPSFAK